MILLEKAFKLIDEYNQQDPNIEIHEGHPYPKEYLDSIRHTQWLNKLAPNATEPMKLAARSQHIGRWEIPRLSYPQNRTGYLKWRSDLAIFHANKTAEILQTVGYDSLTIDRVKELNQKKAIKLDPETQIIEDILCLVFLDNHIESFAQNQSEEKLLTIIQKTWKKMGEAGKVEALKLQYSPTVFAILKKALSL